MQPTGELKAELTGYGFEFTDEQISNYIKGLIGDDELDSNTYHQVLEDIMRQNKAGLNIDWKWACDLIMEDVQACIPELTYSNEVNNEEEGKAYIYKGKIGDKDVNLDGSDSSPNSLINAVNEAIREKVNKEFVEMPSTGDYYSYILVPTDKAAAVREKYPLEG